MDHKAFLKSLDPDVARRLVEKSDRAGMVHLAGHVGLISLFGLYIALQAPFWGLLLPLQGVLIVFLFTLEHEATHKTPFANEVLNEWVGRCCGVMILLPFEWFRYFHLAHHRHTNIPGKDPELGHGEAGDKPDTWARWIMHVSGIPVWISQIKQIVINALGRASGPYLPPRAVGRITKEARIMLGLYALAALSFAFTTLLFWVWILPALIAQPALRLYLLAEHGRCPQLANMFDNTRTTYTNRIIRFVAWNMPYHVEHHVFPNVPFYLLPQLHVLTKDHLIHTEPGYVAFTKQYVADF
ncbi:fatty acid desaturase [Aestuariibius sp. HNIBRBA575]|uniref:fatty acid desaturase n=1 Tax=Aestuariibius sp. HNIBRBA575 TaxID=3233343 RepID=UPI0034A24305